MEVNVSMTAEDFMAFMEWERDKKVYERRVQEVGKNMEHLANSVLKTLVECGKTDEPEYKIESQDAAKALVEEAAEYGDYAVNIYTGCPHRCYYCFAPQVLHREREVFHSCVEPRKDIVREIRRQLEREKITGQTIHLCFTCDPYPVGCDTTTTREVIKVLKEYGNHVQILTKGDGRRDFDLLDGEDWYGVTVSCWDVMAEQKEPGAIKPSERFKIAAYAKEDGIKTWASFEPVLDASLILRTLPGSKFIFDKAKIGKLNYWPSDIDWAQFGRDVEELCRLAGVNYYIKDGLRAEMDKV